MDAVLQFFPTRSIALSIGPVAIHWYGVMYALAFFVGAAWLPRLLERRSLSLSPRERETLVLFLLVGVIFGGRLGYVILYGFWYYARSPLEILAVWHGGMSSHGGFIGVALALWYFARRSRISFLALVDALVPAIALGLALGRIGNFINAEIIGTSSSVPWAMHFPGVEGSRHPVQLYAALKNIALSSSLWCILGYRPQPGRVTAFFLCGYGILRFFVEYFRDQPFGMIGIGSFSLSWGQVYTLPLLVLGIGLFMFTYLPKHRT